MKRLLFLLVFVTATAVWCPASFAQRQSVVGAIPTPLSATGVTGGVDMTGQGGGGTLTVGTVGGPAMDIFTNNVGLAPVPLAVSTDASSLSNIMFNSSSTVFGNIGITQPGGPFFLNIFGGNTGTAVNFLGPVFATITTVNQTGALNFNSGGGILAPNITAMIFAGDGTISLAPNTRVIGALTTTAGANTGTLLLGSGSVLTGAVGGAIGLRAINVVGGSNSAGVNALITGATNAFTFSLGTNTLNIDGALTIANSTPSGVINTTLASPTLFGNIRPTGATNLGSALLVNVTVPSTAVLLVGNQFNIVQTNPVGAQSGTSGSVVSVTIQSPTNPLYTFSAVPPAGTLNGLVAIVVTGIPLLVPIAPPPGVPLPPVVPIAATVVPVLLAVAPVAPTLAATVLAPIGALTDPAAVVIAVAQLAPSVPDLAAPLVTFQGTRQFQSLWLSRLDDILCEQVSQPDKETARCPKDGPRSGWWLKGFGYLGDQGTQGPFLGYDSTIVGTMIAYDAALGRDTRVGLGVGYARTTIDGKTFDAGTDFDSYRATVYAGYEPGRWFVYGDFSFGWNEYSATRRIAFPGVNRRAEAEYSGQDYTGFVTTGYHFFTPGGLTITPLASLQYTHMNLDGYTETGAGDVNLKVKSQNYDFLESGLGVSVARPFGIGGGGTLVPEIHFKWLHLLDNPTLKNTAAFTVAGSPSLTTPGLKVDEDTFRVGGGFQFLSCACSAKTWSLEAVYDYEFRSDDYHAHQGMVKFSHRF